MMDDRKKINNHMFHILRYLFGITRSKFRSVSDFGLMGILKTDSEVLNFEICFDRLRMFSSFLESSVSNSWVSS